MRLISKGLWPDAVNRSPPLEARTENREPIMCPKYALDICPPSYKLHAMSHAEISQSYPVSDNLGFECYEADVLCKLSSTSKRSTAMPYIYELAQLKPPPWLIYLLDLMDCWLLEAYNVVYQSVKTNPENLQAQRKCRCAVPSNDS